jgi:hypothetical protein
MIQDAMVIILGSENEQWRGFLWYQLMEFELRSLKMWLSQARWIGASSVGCQFNRCSLFSDMLVHLWGKELVIHIFTARNRTDF